MRKFLEIYRFTEIKDMSSQNLGDWIWEELQSLYFDFGQKIAEEAQVRYEAQRLREILTSAKYRKWHCGDVHSALSTMVDGHGGKYTKVTIKSIYSVLDWASKIKAEKENANIIIDQYDKEKIKKDAEYWGPYIKWWITYRVDPRTVSVHQYNEAKNSGDLENLTRRYRDTKKSGLIS